MANLLQVTIHGLHAALCLYNSANRDVFEQYLRRVYEYVVNTYISTAFAEYSMREEETHHWPPVQIRRSVS